MSWASRRKAAYAGGVIAFFAVLIGAPIAYYVLTIPPTCSDGIKNGDETGVDTGGSCPLLDPALLHRPSIVWSRSFRVRDGTYSAAAYIENSNAGAGVRYAAYRFGLYDANNILVAERFGTTFLMPGTVTPVLEGRIDTGYREVARTYFEFTQPLTWERMKDTALPVSISGKQLTDSDSVPRLTAMASNGSVTDILAPSFVAVLFDPAGNAFAASATRLDRLAAGGSAELIFTWPDPFAIPAGRIDVIPLVTPLVLRPPAAR